MKLSENFTIAEFTRSDTASRLGIDNSFRNQTHLDNAIWLCKDYLEIIRMEARIVKPSALVDVSSGYRVPALNKAVGGSLTSDHIMGLASDYTIRTMTIEEAFITTIKALRKHKRPFKQLIFEEAKDRNGRIFRWLHLGISRNNQRNEILHRTVHGHYIPIKASSRKNLVEGIL